MNRLEELGRVDAEKAFTKKGARNLREEKKRIVGELKKADGGKVKKKKSRKNPMKDDRAREGLKSKYRKMGMGKMIDSGEIDFSEYKAGGRVRGKQKAQPTPRRPKTPRDQQRQRRMGDRSKSQRGIKVIEVRKDGGKVGGLKKVQPHQKGLKKLPTKVRNKMGYMKKGGRVGMGKAMRGGGCVR
jgi:hypothetical protein